MGSELKILLVEDEVLTAKVIEKRLERAGYKITITVTTGEDAVSTVKETNIDIILMDICLAGEMDGIEAASEIQNIRKTPVIFLTAYNDTETRDGADELKPLAFLNKPVDIKELIKLLERN